MDCFGQREYYAIHIPSNVHVATEALKQFGWKPFDSVPGWKKVNDGKEEPDDDGLFTIRLRREDPDKLDPEVPKRTMGIIIEPGEFSEDSLESVRHRYEVEGNDLESTIDLGDGRRMLLFTKPVAALNHLKG